MLNYCQINYLSLPHKEPFLVEASLYLIGYNTHPRLCASLHEMSDVSAPDKIIEHLKSANSSNLQPVYQSYINLFLSLVIVTLSQKIVSNKIGNRWGKI